MIKIAGKPKELKRVNISLVLDSIKTRESANRAEIVEDTGISHTTVRTLLSELLDENEIVSIGFDVSSGGRRAERYSINTDKKYILSILIEEKKIIYNIVNVLGKVIEEETISIKDIFDNETIDKLLESIMTKYKNIKGVGISVPGIINEEGYLSGKRTKNWKQISINQYIEEKYDIPVRLENDLNAVTLGFAMEYANGQILKDLNIAYINFTTLGAGSGIMINGELVRGKDNFAGEIGFIPIGDSYVNELLFQDLQDEDYCILIGNIITIINCIINPKLIIVGGNRFRYDLMDRIKEIYRKKNRIVSDIAVVENSYKYGLNGITKIALDLINDDIKLIDKREAKVNK